MRNVIVFIILALILGFLFFSQSVVQIVNEDLPFDLEIASAQQLVETARPYIQTYWKGRKYSVGEVSMSLDNKHQGKVSIIFVDDLERDIPNILEIQIDTVQRKTLKITRLPRDSKIYPGRLNFTEWRIDSIEAIDITKSIFKEIEDFNYNSVLIFGTISIKQQEVWSIDLQNRKKRISYQAEIDPYTGEIVYSGIYNWWPR